LDAAAAYETLDLVVQASENPPCEATDVGISDACSMTNCAGLPYNPICILNTSIPVGAVPPINVPCQQVINFTNRMVTWFNNTSEIIRYITIYPKESGAIPFNSVFLDNVKVTMSCLPDVDFTFNIDQCDVTFLAEPSIPGAMYSWDFGDQSTGIGPNPTHSYGTSGTYTVTLTVKDACLNSKTATHTVTVNCVPIPICNCPAGYTVGINQNSINEITTTQIPGFSYGRNKAICVNGKLKINRNQFFLDNIVYMGEGASIEILPGNLLWTSGSDYLPCNGKMYQGLIVSGGIIGAYNNKIYDAHIGIDFQEGATSAGIQGNTFDRNYIGVNILGGIAGDTRILGNHFISNGTYLPAYPNEPIKLGTMDKTWAGVNLQNTTMISVNDNNEFFGIGAGVRATNSILVMNKNHAKDLLYTAALENGSALIATDCASLILNDNLIENCIVGVAVEKSNLSADLNSIDNCGWGFYLDQMNNRNLQISNSKKIYFNSYGIYLTGSSSLTNLNIYSNKLKGLNSIANAGIAIIGNGGSNQGNANIYNHNTEFSIPSGCRGIAISGYQRINIYHNNITYQSGGREGIFLQNAPRCFLGSNTITGDKFVVPNSIGIAVLRSPYNTYCCNNTPGNATGIYFSGDCDQSHVKHNIMSSNNYGLQCGFATWIGFQKLGYSNTWPGSAVNFEALHSGSTNDMVRSKFDVTNGPSDFFPVPTPPALWFEPRAGNNKSCLLDFSCAIPQRPDTVGDDYDKLLRFYNEEDVLISPTDEYTADPLSDWGSYSTGQSWNSKIQLLEKLNLFPELLGQSSLVDSFFNSNQSSLLHDFNAIRIAIRKNANLSQSSYLIFKTINNGILASITHIDSIDQQLTQQGSDTVALMNLRNAELNTLSNLREQYEAEVNSYESQRIVTLNNLYNQTLLLITANAIQAEEKAINLHLIQYLIQGKDYLASSVLATIFIIANQCIHQNSYAISIARMLYTIAIDYEFNDDVICPPSQPVVTNSKNINFENRINIYPNPTKSWVILENLNKETPILKIVVLDIHGRYIQSELYVKSLNFINLSTVNLKSGIYFLKIEYLNGNVILKKLLIE